MSFEKNKNDIAGKFAQYRIISDQTNAAYKIPFKNNFIFLKIYGPKYPRLKYELRKLLSDIGFRQPVEYMSPEKRRTYEAAILAHWKANGYDVPDLIENPFDDLSGFSVLATTFIDGVTLRHVLKSSVMTDEDKANKIAAVFTEMAARHQWAFLNNDNKLFHVDANTRNIIFANTAIYHVDFEMGRPWEPVLVCATREVLKLLVSIAEDVELFNKEIVFSLFKEHYRRDDVYLKIVESVKERPFQFVHLYNDKRKKMREPHKVTLYEVVHHLS
jgi:tRNA A-37 threonylcarbamoyl transferase component Bud32